jgi:hypothetical protein
MPAFATLQLKDQSATERSFAPASINSATGVISWLRSGSTFDSRQSATLLVTLPKTNTSRVKVRGKVSIPVMDPDTGLKKIDELIASFEISLPKNAGLPDRQDLRAYLADFLTDATVVAAVENFESVY